MLEMMSSKAEVDEVLRERARQEEELRRLKRQYREVEIDESDYRRELALTEAKLASLTTPKQDEVVQLGDNVEGIVLAWQNATKEERRDMLRLMLEAVYTDTTTNEIVGLQPKPGFLPLFNLPESVTAGQTVLTADLTAGDPKAQKFETGLGM